MKKQIDFSTKIRNKSEFWQIYALVTYQISKQQQLRNFLSEIFWQQILIYKNHASSSLGIGNMVLKLCDRNHKSAKGRCSCSCADLRTFLVILWLIQAHCSLQLNRFYALGPFISMTWMPSNIKLWCND